MLKLHLLSKIFNRYLNTEEDCQVVDIRNKLIMKFHKGNNNDKMTINIQYRDNDYGVYNTRTVKYF